MTVQRCDNCKFYYVYDGNNYECRRYPPQMVMKGIDNEVNMSCFPDVDEHEWCGEWRRENEQS
jgi:hypothetical protein